MLVWRACGWARLEFEVGEFRGQIDPAIDEALEARIVGQMPNGATATRPYGTCPGG